MGNQLSNNELMGDFTEVITLTLADIQAAGTTATAFATIPAGGGVDVAMGFEAEALAGTTEITLDVGTTEGDPDEFIDALDVDGMSAPVFNSGDGFTGNQSQAIPYQAATSILAEVNGTTASLNAGNIVIGLRIIDLGSFA